MMVYARRLALAFLVVLLVSCSSGGSSPINYYVIDPVATEPMAGAPETLSLELMDVNIPQYLERFQIATRSGTNRLLLSESNQWGENLRKNIMRTMVRNLAVLLSTNDIGTPIERTSSTPKYRIQVFIAQFEQGSDGYVRLVGRWQVIDGRTGKPLSIHAYDSRSERRIGEGEYSAAVDAMRDRLGDLCVEIARSIVAQEDGS